MKEIRTNNDKIIAEITPLLSKPLACVYYIHNTSGLMRLTQNSKGDYILTGWYMLGESIAKRIREEMGINILVEH